MDIVSGNTTTYLYFIAVDPTDLRTRETGLTGFTVVASRNGAADFTYTTPTVVEIDATTMPGLYAVLVDEDTDITAGFDTQEAALHITQASMEPVTEVYTLVRPKITAGNTLVVESDGDLTKVNTLDGHTAQTADHTAGIAAIPTTAMRGTDSAALASVATEARLAELDPANMPADIDAIPTTAMRGTDSAALASVATEARLAELDAGNLPADIAAIPTTAMRGTDGVDTAPMRGTDGVDTATMRGTDSAATEAKQDSHMGSGFVEGTDSNESIRDQGDANWITGAGGSDRLLLVDTTIATLATQISFTLTAGSADDDAYNNCSIVIEDASTATQKAVGMVLAYVGSTKTVTLKEALAFTIAATDKVYILAENSLKSTVANRQLDVTASGAAGIDWGNVENKTTANDLSQTDIQLVDTCAVNSDMRGTDGVDTAPMRGTDGVDTATMRGTDGVDTATMRGTDSALTDKAGFSLSATGLDLIVSTATGAIEIAKAIWDRVLTGATHNIATSAGRRLRNVQDFGIYDMASVWVDEVGGSSSGTLDGEDATVTNRADDFDNAQTVAASVGLDLIHIQNGNTITLAATLNGYTLWGSIYTLALGGQDIGNCSIRNATISGVGTGTTPSFANCFIGTATLPPSKSISCSLTDTLTLGSSGNYSFLHCNSGIPGPGGPTIDANSVGSLNLEARNYEGSLTLDNLAAGDVVTISGRLGTITLNGADATVEIRGTYKELVNNLTGAPTVNIDGAILGSDVADTLEDTADMQPKIGAPAVTLAADIAAVPTVAEFNARSDRNADLIESQRGEHTWQGDFYYVDPVNGDTHANGNRGGRTDPYNSVQDCHDNAVTDYNHDVIFIVAGNVGTPTTLDEEVTISKNYVFLRGPGRDLLWTNTGNNNDTVTITGAGVELSGIRVSTNVTGSPDGIAISGDHARVRDIWLDNCRTDGIHIAGASFCVLDNILAHDGGNSAGDSAIRITGVSDNVQVLNTRIRAQTGSGIIINSTGEHATIDNCLIDECSKYGVEIVAGDSTMLRRNMWHDNVLGDIFDGGTDTHFENNEQWAKEGIEAIWS